ncbi:MAG: DUF501 domain-containing protein [Acidimicrobiia bacterium]
MTHSVVIEAQIGRPLRAESVVVARCHLGLPVVVAVPPILDDGTPFPTRYWLTCPLAVTRIGRLEGSGGVKRMEAKAEMDPRFGEALTEAHRRYGAERDVLVPDGVAPRPSGGVGGTARGVKCLHAHYADTAVGNANPVGQLVAGWIEPLDCTIPCVVDGARNPAWSPRP